MGIYSKLLEIQRSVRALLPNADGNNYKYISGSKVLGIVRPKMDELGVILKTEVLDITNIRQDYTVGRDQRPKSEILSSVKMRFTWIDVESGEKDVCEWSANGQNDWDKGVGSAMTYGERYFILKYFHIATDEDDVDRLPRHEDVGPASKPEPLSEEEVAKLGVDNGVAAPEVDYAVGDNVEITSGTMEGSIGTVEEINLDERKVRIKINMFGREIPAELGLHEVKLL